MSAQPSTGGATLPQDIDPKAQKGLRQFSRQVWMKVMEKRKTTYNEVADELVEEFRNDQLSAGGKMSATASSGVPDGETQKEANPALEERNVRRRVYDALNVLIALGIIVKDRKQIIWKGLPSNFDEIVTLEGEYEARRVSLVNKRRQVRDLILQQLAFRRLVQRNKMQEQENRRQGLNVDQCDGSDDGETDPEFPPVPGRPRSVIHLPLITLSTADTATITLDIIAPQREEATIQFDAAFQVHDDKELIRQMRLHEFPEYHLKKLLPAHLQPYLLKPIDEPPLQRERERDERISKAATAAEGASRGAGVGSGRSTSGTSYTTASASVDRVAEAMKSAAHSAASKLSAHATGSSFLSGTGVSVGPPELSPIVLGPGITGARLFLPSSAAVDVCTRLLGCMGLCTPPPHWRGQHSGACARGAVPVMGITAGWDKPAMLNLLAVVLRNLGGLLSDRGCFASSERITAAVHTASMAVMKDQASVSVATGAAAGGPLSVPRELQTWVCRLLEAVGGYLIMEPKMKEILAEHITGRNNKHVLQRQQANDLVVVYRNRLYAAGGAGSSSQTEVLVDFRAQQAAFNTSASDEWAALLARQRSALSLVEAELLGQAVALLASGWLPDPPAMVEKQGAQNAGMAMSMNTNLSVLRQHAGVGTNGTMGQLPPTGPGPFLIQAVPLSSAAGAGTGAGPDAQRVQERTPVLQAGQSVGAHVHALGATSFPAQTAALPSASSGTGQGGHSAVNPQQAIALLQAMASAQQQLQQQATASVAQSVGSVSASTRPGTGVGGAGVGSSAASAVLGSASGSAVDTIERQGLVVSGTTSGTGAPANKPAPADLVRLMQQLLGARQAAASAAASSSPVP